jgi:hypothetical protein
MSGNLSLSQRCRGEKIPCDRALEHIKHNLCGHGVIKQVSRDSLSNSMLLTIKLYTLLYGVSNGLY